MAKTADPIADLAHFAASAIQKRQHDQRVHFLGEVFAELERRGVDVAKGGRSIIDGDGALEVLAIASHALSEAVATEAPGAIARAAAQQIAHDEPVTRWFHGLLVLLLNIESEDLAMLGGLFRTLRDTKTPPISDWDALKAVSVSVSPNGRAQWFWDYHDRHQHGSGYRATCKRVVRPEVVKLLADRGLTDPNRSSWTGRPSIQHLQMLMDVFAPPS